MATSRDEEYLRRMRALGYEPSLAGMDDEDIEWELARMDRGRAAERPTAPQLNPTYRPVDPGLAARIFRQMGRPYDPSAIDPREAIYIGGWDNGGDEEATRPAGPVVSQGGARRPEPYDPWANTWKLDWGAEGSPAQGPRTMEYRWGRDGMGFPSRGGVENALGYGSGGVDAAAGVQALSHNAAGGGEEGNVADTRGLDDNASSRVKMAGGDGLWKVPQQAVEKILGGFDLAKEVEKEALAQGDSSDLARKKAEDAVGRYLVWQAVTLAAAGGTGAGAAAIAKEGAKKAAAAAGAAGGAIGGALADHFVVKEWIKKQVLSNTEDDYNTMSPGNMPPGPG